MSDTGHTPLVRVKPLEWGAPYPGYIGGEAIPCETIVGRYDVEQYGDWCVYFDRHLLSRGHNSPDEAKAAAQADFERRILSAIETSPSLPILVEALEAFAKAADVITNDLPDEALLFAHFPSMFGGQTELRVGDLRRARDVLASIKGGDNV